MLNESQPRFSFQMLLSSLLLVILLPALVHADVVDWLSRSLFVLTLLACVYLVATRKHELPIAGVLFFPAAFIIWGVRFEILGFVQIKTLTLMYCLFFVMFLLYTISRLFLFLVQAIRVEAETIYASVCLYLVLGLCWAFVYLALVVIIPNAPSIGTDLHNLSSVHGQAVLHEPIYFSFVTQTTLGYGDIDPLSDIARVVAVFQALVGQIYIAIVIAGLVGLQISKEMKRENI